MKKLGIYVHIPFCKNKCIYCDFYSLPGMNESAIEAYVRALGRHITAMGNLCKDYIVDTIFFGGGTPSCLGAARLTGVLDCIANTFTVSDSAEITLEANPESTDSAFLQDTFSAGFNRISFGVQSFDDRELKSIGRIHSSQQAISAVKNAYSAGFRQISLDLMYALPSQTHEIWMKNLSTATSLPITHISCYGLRPEEGTPLFSSPMLKKIPDDDMQADMYLEAVEFLEQNGFKQYEISNFAKEGCRCRHNMKYWQTDEYLGFGPGAASDFSGERTMIIPDLKQYLENDEPVFTEKDVPTAYERKKEQIMLSLRTTDGLCLDRPDFYSLAELLSSKELGIIENGCFCLTPKGFLLSNSIICRFWELMDD